MRKMTVVLLLLGIINVGFSQTQTDTLNYKKVYGLGLKADVNLIIEYLDTLQLTSQKDIDFKNKFLSRFKYQNELVGLPVEVDDETLALYRVFEEYWRKGLRNPEMNFDQEFKKKLVLFFQSSGIDSASIENLASCYHRFLESKTLYFTEFGKTGKFYDLLLYKTRRPEERTVQLIDTTVTVKVYFMEDFVSLGWIEYVRLGNYYPGGWATEDGLFCVTKGYDDLSSEKFTTHFLKHEAQHYADRTRFSNLPAHKLEYRAKLLELNFSNTSLYQTLDKFIRKAKKDSTNSHPYANFQIVGALSKKIFGQSYVENMDRWEKISKDEINKTAKELYLEDTALLIEQKDRSQQ